MTQTSTGTRGEPQMASTGNSPTFAADLSLLATYAAEVGVRKFATQSAMDSSTGSAAGELAQVTAIPGGLWMLIGTTWTQLTAGQFANAAARSAAVTTPRQGMKSVRADLGRAEDYWLAYNASTNPTSPYLVSGWYSAQPAGKFKATTISATTSAIAANQLMGGTTITDPDSGWNASAKTFTIQRGGWYDLDCHFKQATTTTQVGVLFMKAGTTFFQSLNGPAQAFSGIQFSWRFQALPGDVLSMQNGGSSWTMQGDGAAIENNFWALSQIGF